MNFWRENLVIFLLHKYITAMTLCEDLHIQTASVSLLYGWFWWMRFFASFEGERSLSAKRTESCSSALVLVGARESCSRNTGDEGTVDWERTRKTHLFLVASITLLISTLLSVCSSLKEHIFHHKYTADQELGNSHLSQRLFTGNVGIS